MINDIDINEIVVSNKLPFGQKDFIGFKNFIGYKDNEKIRPLCIFFPEKSIYKRYFDKTKCIYFVHKRWKFLDKYMNIWKIVNNLIIKNE